MSSINDLFVQQLRQAADLKEKIEGLQKELSQLVGSTAEPVAIPVTAKAPKKGMSAAGRARIAAAAKARWAKAKLSIAMKAAWAARKAAKK